MKCLVTGCAGFIGSSLAEKLLLQGHEVLGIDRLSDYYDRALKRKNLEALSSPAMKGPFTFFEADLAEPGWEGRVDSLRDSELVYHLAAQPGVGPSWTIFDTYVRDNILATRGILEVARSMPYLKAFVLASSSSVYGNASSFPVTEEFPLAPCSPYGITKVAAEKLCGAYHENFALPVVILRYFTVYGPRQRPDMAFYRFIKSALRGERIVIHGDGSQERDFTHVDDVTEAHVALLEKSISGGIFNITSGPGGHASLNELVALLGGLVGRKLEVEHREPMKGDMAVTRGSYERARGAFGYEPRVSLRDGMTSQVSWMKSFLS
ncbi:MAG: NAD-dependent epimerase/dehydratase family protein [Candidatus Eremiobacteraeota bacterium]|nr:NAD-dependent epimerase/dehydratase family protein [Candidatus Eremiobacteraeota bacterium]